MNINPFDILKNAQKIQEQMNGFQEKLGYITATGAAAAGLVEVDFNGKLEVLAVRIAPQAMDDAEMLQDLVMAAITDGMTKVKEAIAGQAGAMGFPGTL
ncbi:MAG: YbaB/EbfC family nucleoid-associated protein [Treponema sp.]|nr:YbaB/EbfC family nucleoid-associated protein [Treponema sp.]MCL2238301.1 YbaB/EbfC family nucleoid-associated protein [Treponema sp.]